ncbi:MAG: fibronectin type III domain-containing protein [Eubacteriales bacterium]|nr:fibronectin type III domain-containing protein [Eubacteriales bacterium]
MKKFLSVFLSIIMLVSCTFSVSFSAFANTKKTAQELQLYGYAYSYVDSNSKECWVKFVPASSGYYEFACSGVISSGMALGSIYDATGEVLMMNACTAGDADFVTAAELIAGDTYYFLLESDGTPFATYVTVKPHNHIFNSVENYPAVYDANEPSYNTDGANYTFCAYCSDYLTNAVYYCPAKMTLSGYKTIYNGKTKRPAVKVYDRAGNLIPSSNYTVTYKNNKNPGKATVTVKFNNVNYSGTMTAYLTILPKKPTLSSVKSPKKKQLKISWKKDSTISDYQLQYSTSKKFYKSKTKTITVSKKSTSKTISKLKSGKKYYVRIRSYKTISGKKTYGSWSSVKYVKVK